MVPITERFPNVLINDTSKATIPNQWRKATNHLIDPLLSKAEQKKITLSGRCKAEAARNFHQQHWGPYVITLNRILEPQPNKPDMPFRRN